VWIQLVLGVMAPAAKLTEHFELKSHVDTQSYDFQAITPDVLSNPSRSTVGFLGKRDQEIIDAERYHGAYELGVRIGTGVQ
jgi:hypothetical protein